MKRVYLPVIFLCVGTIVSQSGPNKQKSELFVAHVNPPNFASSSIPVDVCDSIIVEADRIMQSNNGSGFESVDNHDLLIAQDNLRACATTGGIARLDRDSAVGLYGEVIAEEQNQPMDVTKEDLEKLLQEAEKAHGEYEKKLGHRDDNWPSWYAEFIVKKLRGREKAK